MATAAERKAVPETLIDKIAALPAGRVAEVEDFVDFLRQREAESEGAHALRTAAMTASAASFAAVWNSPEDDVYDGI
jgi:erythromycin esterase-like protein